MTVYPAYQDDPVRQAEGAVPHQNPQTRQAAGADSEDRGSCRQVPGDVRGIQLSYEEAESSGMKKIPYH